jgi:hypothetical protein
LGQGSQRGAVVFLARDTVFALGQPFFEQFLLLT